MGRALTPAELAALLAAYALDALDADERAQVEAWLARAPHARREVDELRETASLLAQAVAEPPPALWSRIEERLGDPPPPLRLVGVMGARPGRTARRGRTVRSRWLAVAAVLALAVAVSLGVVVGHEVADQDARLDRLAARMREADMREAALAAAMEPGARVAPLATADGTVRARIVTTAAGEGYFMAEDLPRLPPGRTYQLWALMSDDPRATMVSIGTLGRAPRVRAFVSEPRTMGFAVTAERSPGGGSATQPVMLEGRLA